MSEKFVPSLNENKYSLLNSILGLYVGISVIYWIPNIAVETLRIIKFTIFAFINLYSAIILIQRKYINFPKFIFGMPGFFILLFLYLPSIFMATESLFFDTFLNLLSFYCFLWIIYLLHCENVLQVQRLLTISVLIISFFTVVHIFDVETNIIGLTPPDAGRDLTDFKSCGFNLSRTGWSNGLSIFIPVLFVINIGFLRWVLVLLLLYSQFLCGGRTGIISSLVITIIFLLTEKKYVVTLFGALIIFIFYLINEDLVIESMRLNRLSGGATSKASLDDFTANRIVGMEYGLTSWLNNPIFGSGLKQARYISGGDTFEIHNFWIKTLAESGLIVTLFLSVFVFLGLFYAIKITKIIKFGLPIMLGGIIMTFSEPNAIFGSFQNYALWWLVFGIVLAEKLKNAKFINLS